MTITMVTGLGWLCLLALLQCAKATAGDGWSECTLTCGGGTQYHVDNRAETRYCNTHSCPGDAGCLSAYLSFDRGHVIERTIYDASHNGNLATMQGGASVVEGGKFGRALNLTRDGNVTFDIQHFRNRPTLAITIALWLKLSEVKGSQEVFFTCGNPVVLNIGAYHIGIEDGVVTWSLKNENGTDLFKAISDKPIESNKWVHIAGTHRYSTGIANLYINGNLSKGASAPRRHFPPGVFNDWACADMGNPRDKKPLVGLIDEFYIFKCALLPEEISDLYSKNAFKRYEIPRPVSELGVKAQDEWPGNDETLMEEDAAIDEMEDER
ncbi:predicted protein [Nematostella vectensis]|uniref:LamG-like jellyroll fold domain-containing protein n=1 Tax=Nematostella vectensis TaxID=45351 RepID=A7RK85_NEMVE|nr:uncharacterized protein LOC5520431 [Nematostella vectensis]EDO48205.1 predicted protein [Nematostella vectensis]|eukprot:XP_001640268.1 predicted protein [Nematostella vectensis]